jgi:uncharacterized protein (TIGR02246 family)
MRLLMTIAAAALAAQPLAAQSHAGHQPSAETAVAPGNAQAAEVAAVRAVLAQYHAAIERLDATGTEKLFAADSAVFETGGVEGSYADYLGHHLGPELAEFKSFKFSDYKADVRLEGPVALATETYKYRIETKDGTIAERQGVTTSVLKKIDGSWKILVSHNSGRKPKGS